MGPGPLEKQSSGGTLARSPTCYFIPPGLQEKVAAALAAITRKAHSNSLRKWRKLLGFLCSITPAVAG